MASLWDPDPSVSLLPSAAWLCVPLSLHSQDGLGDAPGDKSPLLFFILQLFMKYLKPSSRANIILKAVKNMRSPSDYSISLAAYMVETLVSGSDFYPGQVGSPRMARPMLQPTGECFLPRLHTWLVHLKLADCNGNRSSSQRELGKQPCSPC